MGNLDESVSEAWQHHTAGRWFEAAAACRRILGEAPDDPRAQHLLGVIACRHGNYEAAIAWLGKAAARPESTAEWHDDLGLAYSGAGRLDDAAASHRRALALWPDRAAAHHRLGKVLRAQGKSSAALASLRQAVALAPECPEAHFDLGNSLAVLGDRTAAAACYRAALQHNPDYAEAYTNLGLMLFERGEFAEAAICYRDALARDPNSAIAHNNLGNACERRGDLEAATAAFERAVTLDPSYVAPRINLGNVILERGDPATAIACYESAIRLAPEQAEAHRNYGLVRLMLGDLPGGWAQWRWPAGGPQRFAQPEWRGERLHGATILLYAEQGFGDILHFVRYVPLVAARGGRVILEVPAELRRFLTDMPGAAQILTCGETLPDFDWQCSLLSLPLAFGTELSTIPAQVPYIPVPETAPPIQLAGSSAGGLRVGLVWAGRPEHNRDRHRSLPLPVLAPLWQVPEVAFYALQKGRGADEIAAHSAAMPLIDLGSSLADFTDTAAAIAALDLVITVDTSVAHLAGALGRPVWILLSAIPDWRWLLDRCDSPWYPSARLFRQATAGDWEPVVEEVAAALAALPAGQAGDAGAALD